MTEFPQDLGEWHGAKAKAKVAKQPYQAPAIVDSSLERASLIGALNMRNTYNGMTKSFGFLIHGATTQRPGTFMHYDLSWH
jgi:hypothetical protein